jgi:hypothetical protein
MKKPPGQSPTRDARSYRGLNRRRESPFPDALTHPAFRAGGSPIVMSVQSGFLLHRTTAALTLKSPFGIDSVDRSRQL